MPFADIYEASRPPSPNQALIVHAISIYFPSCVASDEAPELSFPPSDWFNFLGLPDNVRDKIYSLSCPEMRVYPSYTSTHFRTKLLKVEEAALPAPSGATRTSSQFSLPVLLVSKQVNLEFSRIIYFNSPHVMPKFGYIPSYFEIMTPKPKLLESIKNFEVSFSAMDDDSSLIDSEFLFGKPPSCAEARISQLVRPQEEISRVHPLAQDPHEILLKSLLQVWQLKRAQILKLIGPERIILRLDQARCRGGCHRLHRCVLYTWMDGQNQLPDTLRIKGLPSGEVLDDFITELRGTERPAPTANGRIAQEMLEHYVSFAQWEMDNPGEEEGGLQSANV